MGTHDEENLRGFRYEQLDESKREIRLVRLALTSDNESPCGTIDKLQLQLEHRSLNDHVAFSALSYCWNTKKTSQRNFSHDPGIECVTIKVNNEDIRQAMDFIYQTGSEALETDAPGLIYEIGSWQSTYYRNTLVIDRVTGHAEEIENRACELCKGNDKSSKTFKIILRTRDTAELWVESPLTKGLHHILINPYWTRIWIFQEVVLARKARVMIGDKKVSLAQLEAAFGAIGFSPLDHRLFSIRSLEIRRSLDGSHIPLRNVLWQANASLGRSHHEATNAQDIVLGLLSILPPDEIETLSVNFGTSDIETFIKITRHFFRNKRADTFQRCIIDEATCL
ncbi:hypothetical protein DSL72_006303 [Monilinia vaccinii-corymbosi]|uniref:Heterokaryon incompatibility domain-containing protein n=1 Tax=Monilinia vaccinii-corymbosi TaxID=61207 RepID=A0A8A3PNM4_9HELO|nr:hypothetical protein DSL72_006303 [Monilinia vaccinii-corymbosi]